MTETIIETRTWYSYETNLRTIRDEVRQFLHENRIHYELSGAVWGYHFEVLVSDAELSKVNDFLETLF